jgi:hypothetical protein
LAQTVNFSLHADGPRSVVRGRMAILAVGTTGVSGTPTRVAATVSNLPPNSRGYIISNTTRYPNTTSMGVNLNDRIGVKIVTTSSTPYGKYTYTVTYVATQSDGVQVARKIDIPLEVRPLAQPLAKQPFPPDVPLPGLAQWESNMLTYGAQHVAENYIGCCSDSSGVWYYDGARAFLQMADYAGNASFLDYARRINEAYRDNQIATDGSRKYAVYPHGLREFYLRFGDQKSKDAIAALHKYPGFSVRPQWGAAWDASRETAFGLSTHIVAESLGFPRRIEPDLGYEPGESLFDECLANVLGHFEQWFISETADFVYPFLVGLSAEALIDYYEVSGDPEVPYLLKLAADKMYPNPLTWDEASQSMMIVEETNGVITRGPAVDLNMMIAPLYGWVFQQTGDGKYRDIGDRLFASGAANAYLSRGKQFTQNDRWSFKYLAWRKSPVSAAAPPAPPSGLQVTQVSSQD